MFLSILSGIAQMAVKQEQMCGRMTAMEEQTSSGTLPLWSYSEILFLQSILACLVVLQSTVIYWPTSWFVHQQIWISKCHRQAEQLKIETEGNVRKYSFLFDKTLIPRPVYPENDGAQKSEKITCKPGQMI